MTPTPASHPTPQQREDRIAELRARRRARMRVLAVRSAIGVGVLAVIVALALYWLLMTLGGRDFLLAQVAARLPADARFTWQSAEGPVAGPMTVHGLHFDYHGTVFDARRVTIDPDIRPLLGKLLRLDALDIEGASLTIPESDKPFELPRWPDVLPKIELPLGLQADTIRIDGLKVAQAGQPLIDARTLRGGLDARKGKLQLKRIVVDSDRGHFVADGSYDPRQGFATDLTVSALLPAPAGRTRPRLGLVARGDLARMDVAVSGSAPGPLRLRLALRGKDTPRWTLHADSKALDPALLIDGEPGTPLAFELDADGVGGEARLHGKLNRGDLVAVLQPSRLRVQDQVLELKPLVIDILGGRITARGRGDFNVPGNATFRFAVQVRDLTFGGATTPAGAQEAAPTIGADATFGLAGTTKAWAAIGKATLTRGTLVNGMQRATVDFDGRGNADRLALKTLHVAMPTGTLDAGGVVGWTPGLHWDLDARFAGFDPGYFASEWPGAINGRFTTTGNTRNDGGLELQVDADQLGGRLRGRRLDGRATFAMHGAATGQSRTDYDGDIALTLGGSRIDARGKVTDALDVDAKLSPLQLADLLPGAAGVLRGTLALSGRRNAPDIAVDLAGSGLKYADYTAADLGIQGRLPWKGDNGTLAITASDLDTGVALQTLRIDARGAVENLRVDAAARGEIGALDLGGDITHRGNRWQGTLATLHLSPAKGADWRLQSPAHFAQTANGWTLSQSCFDSSGGGTLCADADWPRRGLAINADALPLTLAEPYLPQRDNGKPWSLHGDIALDGQVRPAGDAYAGSLKVTSASGGLRTRAKARRDVLDYSHLVLDASFDARSIHGTLATNFNGDGRIDAKIQTGWDSYAPLSGQVAIDTDELTWLELFSPDIVDPAGTLDGRIGLGGTRAEPSLGGQARLRAFTAELPALGIVLQQGNMQLDARGDGSAAITGSVISGDGTLHVDGTLGWRGDNAPLQLTVRGDNVLVSDTRDLHAVASPDIAVRYTAGQPLEVTGKVVVPSALIDLERLDAGVSASDDVVVLDPADPEAGPATPLALDLSLVMGDDVRLRGFGLDGTLGGRMQVDAVPGRDMKASGALEVGGIYKAYGQKLAITRGHLQWSNTPIDDPILDIRAEREIEAEGVTAGINVTGRATSPQVAVWTDPATSQSDALSYLALGRSTSSLSGKEGQQLNAAAMALNAGGNLLASQLGSKIGLDSAGISDSRALGGSVLGIGKKLSPRLYVGFGVSLLGTGQVLTLKYLLGKGFDLEIESSTLESRGSINWRKEK